MRERFVLLLTLAGVAAVMSLSPFASRLEEDLGLDWLFRIRGVEMPPEGAAVIAIDEESVAWLQRNGPVIADVAPEVATCLGPEETERLAAVRNATELPRALLACLVDRLDALDPLLIIFDVHFAVPMPGDAALARALARSGRVLLLERVTRLPPYPGAEPIEHRRGPDETLREAALGTVGFHVESAPGRRTTRYRSRFESFPDLPVMPVEAFRRSGGTPPPLAPRHLFWLYGPPWTVPTWSVRDLLDPAVPPPTTLAGRVLFVGASSHSPSDPIDDFPVPAFGRGAGGVSGVELAATAFLNLRADQMLRTPGPLGRAALASGTLLAVGGLALFGSPLLGLGGALALTAAVVAGAVALFHHGIWLPVVLPLLIGVPLILLLAVGRRMRLARRVALSLAPHAISSRMLDERPSDARPQMATALFVDIASSTTLAQTLSPERFAELLGVYYRLVADAVERNGGSVYDYVGDGVLALYPEAEVGPAHAVNACATATAIAAALTARPRAVDLPPLLLRIGLSSGPISMGALRFGDHLSVAALGDPVYRASRLQEMGKELIETVAAPGVIVLLDENCISRMPVRPPALSPYGRRTLRGRSTPLAIYRLAV